MAEARQTPRFEYEKAAQVAHVLTWLDRGQPTVRIEEETTDGPRWIAFVSDHKIVQGRGDTSTQAALRLVEQLERMDEAVVLSHKITLLPLSEALRAYQDERAARMCAVYMNLGGDWWKVC